MQFGDFSPASSKLERFQGEGITDSHGIHQHPKGAHEKGSELGGKERLSKQGRVRQGIHSAPTAAAARVREYAQEAGKEMTLEDQLRPGLVGFLISCERAGILTINREWLAKQRGRAATVGVR